MRGKSKQDSYPIVIQAAAAAFQAAANIGQAAAADTLCAPGSLYCL
jgi:hypothetical protein